MPPLHTLVIIFVPAASLTIPWNDKPSNFLTQCFVDFLQACRFLFQQVWVIIPTSFIIVCTLIDRPVESMRNTTFFCQWIHKLSLSKLPPTNTDDGVQVFVLFHIWKLRSPCWRWIKLVYVAGSPECCGIDNWHKLDPTYTPCWASYRSWRVTFDLRAIVSDLCAVYLPLGQKLVLVHIVSSRCFL